MAYENIVVAVDLSNNTNHVLEKALQAMQDLSHNLSAQPWAQ
jgi:hypothetical protein